MRTNTGRTVGVIPVSLQRQEHDTVSAGKGLQILLQEWGRTVEEGALNVRGKDAASALLGPGEAE